VYLARLRASDESALYYVLRQDVGVGLFLASPNLDGRDATANDKPHRLDRPGTPDTAATASPHMAPRARIHSSW
jgi:hypothetical protein